VHPPNTKPKRLHNHIDRGFQEAQDLCTAQGQDSREPGSAFGSHELDSPVSPMAFFRIIELSKEFRELLAAFFQQQFQIHFPANVDRASENRHQHRAAVADEQSLRTLQSVS